MKIKLFATYIKSAFICSTALSRFFDDHWSRGVGKYLPGAPYNQQQLNRKEHIIHRSWRAMTTAINLLYVTQVHHSLIIHLHPLSVICNNENIPCFTPIPAAATMAGRRLWLADKITGSYSYIVPSIRIECITWQTTKRSPFPPPGTTLNWVAIHVVGAAIIQLHRAHTLPVAELLSYHIQTDRAVN